MIEGAIFMGGFVYMAIPGLFTIFSLWHPEYNDVAGFMYLILGVLFYWEYGFPFMAIGCIMALCHLWLAWEIRRAARIADAAKVTKWEESDGQ